MDIMDNNKPLNCLHPVPGKAEVKLNTLVWFHGKISRDDAENLLHPRAVSPLVPVRLIGLTDEPPAGFSIPLNSYFSSFLIPVPQDGLFLVRESTNFPGDYTLCVCYNGKVEHYRIIYKDNKLTIDEEEFFDNLSQLVEVCFLFRSL